MQGQEAKILLVDHSYYSERTHSHFHPLIPGPVNPCDGRNSTIATDLEHIAHSGRHCSSNGGYCQPAVAVTESSKGRSTVLSSQLFQDDGECGQTIRFHEHGPNPTLHVL